MHFGFKVVSLAIDPDAGVNCRGPNDFSTIPVLFT